MNKITLTILLLIPIVLSIAIGHEVSQGVSLNSSLIVPNQT
ncbi:hypothetical protein [Agarivorans albus]|uniref:Uncharacterized protein n=1 Tax=Agarivorans albus MKT 106 TaxID=1331007 RepID=R9PPE9_AGAAL|nr:hypothetical protein [Agarivorans albus]GAD03185.1 hypothetical protein AALB_3265 [Agarivorans albus MKT 106]